jgi:hypothetical protein
LIAQITLTAEQVKTFANIFQYLVWPLLLFILRYIFTRLSSLIVASVAEIKETITQEVKNAVVAEFRQYEQETNARITKIESTLENGPIKSCTNFSPRLQTH